MTPNDICVVIPVLNEEFGIAATIRSAQLAGQIVVVDGGSVDSTAEIVNTFANVIWITSRPGRGFQLAVGAAQCDRKIILFLHGDCRLSCDSLIAISEAISRGHRWGALRQQIDANGWRYRLLEQGNAARVKICGVPFGDQAMFTRMDLYREVGGFDDIPLMEDLRLSKKLRRVAWPLLVNSAVIVDARRWARRGVIRQTFRNWMIQLLHAAGVSPQKLAKFYR